MMKFSLFMYLRSMTRRDIFLKFIYSEKASVYPGHKHAKWPPSDLTPWTLTLIGCHVTF